MKIMFEFDSENEVDAEALEGIFKKIAKFAETLDKK
jgi:hypothetical protein